MKMFTNMQAGLFRLCTIAILLAIPTFSLAGTATPAQEGASFNVLLTFIISLIVILLFAIAVLANVVRSLAAVWAAKHRQEAQKRGVGTGLLTLLLLLLPLGQVLAQEPVAPAATTTTIAGIAASDFYLLLGVVGLELLIIASMLLVIVRLVRLLNNRPEAAQHPKPALATSFWERFNKAVSIQKEEDIMLDHDYDGIKELDNSLPPWWKYGFYLTIVVSVIYMYYYHVSSGPSSLQEYAAEVKLAEEQKALYLAKSANNVDENTIVMLDAAGISAGEQLFQTTCAACHVKDGGGGVGPNLTDDYWLHGGSIQDIFKSIKYGWPDKGMKSWKDDFSPKQIAELTSFVKSLRGTQPAAPKEKQGELYNETAGKADSTSIVIK